MKHKKLLMLSTYYAPGIIALIRITVTMWFFVKDPLGMPLRFLQIVPLIAICVTLFMHFKLYQDGVPVITVIAPTLVHAVLMYVFERKLVFIPFLLLLGLDIVFLSLKGAKASLFPFDIDDDTEDDLAGIEDILEA